MFVLGAITEEASRAVEPLVADGQPDLRRLLDVAHPLAVHVRGANIEPSAIQNEPDRDFVGLPGLASVMSQGRGLLARYLPQSRNAFGSISSRLEINTSGKSLNVPKLFLSHSEIVPQFVHERLADLLTDFCLTRTDGFDVLLVKHDVGWTCR